MIRANRIRFGLLTLAALLALATAAQAELTEWQFNEWGYWDDATKWTNGVPDQYKDAVLDKYNATYFRSGSTNSAASLVVGKSTGSYHNLSAEANASLAIANDMQCGVLSGARGDFGIIEGCSLTVGGNLIVGDAGDSESYTRGALEVTGGLYMANSSPSSYGSLTSFGDTTFGYAYIGVCGNGGLTQANGKGAILGDLTAGVHNGSQGAFGLSNGPGGEFKVNNVVLGVEAGSQGRFYISDSGGKAEIAGNLTAGNYGSGSLEPRGGQLTAGNITLAQEAGSEGGIFITGQASLHATNLVVGQAGQGAGVRHSFTGDPGNPVVNISGKLIIGATKPPGWDPAGEDAPYGYSIYNGTLNAGRLEVGAGRFVIVHAATVINITQSLNLSADASFFAVAGSTIIMTGADFINYSTHPDYLWGLGNLSLIFSGGGTTWRTLEIGGKDYGIDSQGFYYNFHLANLTVTGNNTRVALLDKVNNGNRGPGSAPEALYVSTLNVNPEATLNLNHLPLYTYLDGLIHRVQAGEGHLFGGGQIINSSLGGPMGATMLLLLE
jgi:T5SS/PEP-CTERM-associated repeat protein